LQSWVEPYPKPIILNHDLNSEPIGRVMAARMDKEEDGSSFVRLQIAITDPVAVQKVMDKRYLTGSVGGRAGKAVCSISGDDLANLDESGKPKMARFKRGQVYKGKLAFIDMQDISFKEYSFVNQPADSKSSVRAVATPGSNAITTSDSEWVARSSAFVLSMDKEDIFSVEENESLFANLKSKESRPLYLHLKGAFLSAMAIQESENYINTNDPLLSHENDNKDVHEENLTMNENVKDEDILATVEELSQDLSTLSNTKVEESQDPETAPETEEVVEETPVTDAPETEESVKTEQDLENQAVDALKKANEKIAELEAQIAKDSSKAQATDEQESTETVEKTEVPTEEVVDSANAPAEGETQATEESNTNLTDEKVVSEQDVDDATKKLQELEEENKKLKSAMHRTLVERVVDTKIATGIESHELREELIGDHLTRSASSLADSLRDLAKLPTVKSAKGTMPEINSELTVIEGEDNVYTLDKQEDLVQEDDTKTPEQLFVDALMGRRKL
jgi:hypothetical protein